MKRLHVHLAVTDLAEASGFYTTLFGTPPSVAKHDYAKWLIDDPRVNFVISSRRRPTGLDHLGIQVDSGDELEEVAERLAAGIATVEQPKAHCCYAASDKVWATDPAGVAWETFHTYGDRTTYGDDRSPDTHAARSACCA